MWVAVIIISSILLVCLTLLRAQCNVFAHKESVRMLENDHALIMQENHIRNDDRAILEARNNSQRQASTKLEELAVKRLEIESRNQETDSETLKKAIEVFTRFGVNKDDPRVAASIKVIDIVETSLMPLNKRKKLSRSTETS